MLDDVYPVRKWANVALIWILIMIRQYKCCKEITGTKYQKNITYNNLFNWFRRLTKSFLKIPHPYIFSCNILLHNLWSTCLRFARIKIDTNLCMCDTFSRIMRSDNRQKYVYMNDSWRSDYQFIKKVGKNLNKKWPSIWISSSVK